MFLVSVFLCAKRRTSRSLTQPNCPDLKDISAGPPLANWITIDEELTERQAKSLLKSLGEKIFHV
jgi:hypothetical protein